MIDMKAEGARLATIAASKGAADAADLGSKQDAAASGPKLAGLVYVAFTSTRQSDFERLHGRWLDAEFTAISKRMLAAGDPECDGEAIVAETVSAYGAAYRATYLATMRGRGAEISDEMADKAAKTAAM